MPAFWKTPLACCTLPPYAKAEKTLLAM